MLHRTHESINTFAMTHLAQLSLSYSVLIRGSRTGFLKRIKPLRCFRKSPWKRSKASVLEEALTSTTFDKICNDSLPQLALSKPATVI